MPPFIHEDQCKKCLLCVEACQSDVFYGSVRGAVPVVTYPDECWHCNACVIECPTGAVEIRLPLNLEPMYQERG
ncbi:MAG: ferredoxin family protein [Desulfovibrio sp.]|uniref:4Fe-4S dicluster domain-containing protein n=1 Tax=Desulfovibrio sp. TaxID=885 RepID=UPI0019871676|nr:ferredoxin family protein [Desulfovibrio sp.]MBD5416851.1 ferredoxin family protein [Desulfovibrio sp.]MBD5646385.1 ferredoxin family protein [Desulfovibrio sp.]